MRIRSAVAAVATLALTAGVMSSASADPGDPATPPAAPAEDSTSSTDPAGTDEAGIEVAEQALADAQALLDEDPATQPVVDRDATIALRDLAAHRDLLGRSQRSSADRLLARPGAQRVKCGRATCVHWTSTGSHAPPPDDASPNNGVPDFVDATLATMERVHRTYVRAGYRAPLKDRGRGGNRKRDVYLRNIGPNGLYGYCTTDQKPRTPPDNVWAFCVLDNDYSPAEFPTNSPLDNMRVTAAHEYFHAVQFAYDFLEDGWFMEATATWAEDELYDSVNDNYNYLPASQIRRTRKPLDGFLDSNVYGNWIYFRYLTERMGRSKAGMPVIIRNMWRKADAKRGAPDQYSIQAIKSVLRSKHRNFVKTYASFASANRRTHSAYNEGASLDYPVAPAWTVANLSRSHRKSGVRATRLDHLTSATARFNPGSGLGGSRWKLQISADLAPKATGSAVVVAVYRDGGGVSVRQLRLNKDGVATRAVAFSSATVDHVDVTLVNASTSYRCGVAAKGFGTWACSGRPLENNLRSKVRGVAFR